jgi:hypothetical protein
MSVTRMARLEVGGPVRRERRPVGTHPAGHGLERAGPVDGARSTRSSHRARLTDQRQPRVRVL